MGDLCRAASVFESARNYVLDAGFDKEVEWQRKISLVDFTETDLLRESAWVILCSGFRVSVVQRIFDYISLCFCDWESSKSIVSAYPMCYNAAFASFGNQSKINAIVGTARIIDEIGFCSIREMILQNPVRKLQIFPFIGPVTSYHLAKNLGYETAKSDRHLKRLADTLEFESVAELCRAISDVTGENIRVIDLVLWRYLADTKPRSH